MSTSLDQQGLSFYFVPRDVLSWPSACPRLVFCRCRRVGYRSDQLKSCMRVCLF